VFPDALVQWEDFASGNAFRILRRHRDRLPSFNDDIQGTGAVVVAGLQTALLRAGRPMRDERVLIVGAGAAGGGCAFAIRDAMREDGATTASLASQVLLFDSKGPLLNDRNDLRDHKVELAADHGITRTWTGGAAGRTSLLEVVRNFRPTFLLGLSGQRGSFTQDVVTTMHSACARPIIFPLSNPTDAAEATPADVLGWTNGAALVATGSPFAPVELGGKTHVVGQGNNALIFPGVGLGCVAARARKVPDSAFLAASKALTNFAADRLPTDGSLYPPISMLRDASRAVASAVARELVRSGAAAAASDDELDARIAATIWEPVYVPYRPAR